MTEIGLAVPESGFAHDLDEAIAIGERDRLPDHGPARRFILGGAGTGIAHDRGRARPRSPPRASPRARSREILVERSIAGWKEYELEVMRDRADNCVVVCSIENFDPMGVHTGDSITVAPAQTLSDVEYQAMRDAAFALHPPRRGRDRRLEHPVRRRSRDRRAARHRDEPAGLALVGARLEGDGLPDREDRGPPRGRLHASTRSRTTSRRRRRRASSRRSTTS